MQIKLNIIWESIKPFTNTYYIYILNDRGLFGSLSVTLYSFLSSWEALHWFLGFSYFVNLFFHISDLIGLEKCDIYWYIYIIYIQMLV